MLPSMAHVPVPPVPPPPASGTTAPAGSVLGRFQFNGAPLLAQQAPSPAEPALQPPRAGGMEMQGGASPPIQAGGAVPAQHAPSARAVATPGSQAAAAAALVDSLRELSDMRAAGVLEADEFAAAKKRLLAM